MKSIFNRFLTVFCLLFVGIASTFAERISLDDAALVANNFMNTAPSSSLKKSVAPKRMVLKKSASTEQPQFYIYENAEGEGWVMVAANDIAHPILAYSETGKFRTDNQPTNLKSWLGHYEKEIQLAEQKGVQATNEIVQEWRTLRNGGAIRKATPVVSPLIQTGWDQTAPFWNDCPKKGGNYAYTGCVATAMAQVLNYWQWPNTGVGSNSVMFNSTTYTVDFTSGNYDWANMLNIYTSSANASQKAAVAKLMYHCGVAAGMEYGTDGSGAYTINWNDESEACAQNALWKYLKYKKSSIKGYYRNGSSGYYTSWTKTNWINMLKAELDAGRPILYAGDDNGSPTPAGHSFVCDGYDSSDKMHFNWGWENWCDGYYDVDALETTDPGSGGGNGNYSYHQDVIVGIIPDKPNITITWSVQGVTSTTTQTSGTLVLPATTPSDCTSGKKFVGWTKSSSISGGTRPSDLFTSGTKSATESTTYYAVYATAGSGGGSSTTTYTFTIDKDDFTNSGGYAANNGEHTSTAVDVDDNTNTLDITWTSNQVYQNGDMQWQKSNGYIYNNTDLGKINSVTVSTVSGSFTTYYGTSEQPTNTSLGTNDGYFKVVTGTSSAGHTNSITVNFSKTSGGGGTTYSDYSLTCTPCTLTGITLNTTGATTTFTQGQTFTAEGLVVTASYSDCSDRTVSPTSVSSPDMSTTGDKTVTVTYTEGGETKTKTYTITVNPLPTYTIRFFDGTTQIGANQEVTSGQSATKPSDPADCTDNGYTFVGWYTSKLADDNTTVTSGWITDFTATQNQDYYAVYKHVDGDEGNGVTFLATGQSYSNGDDAGSKEISGVTFAYAKGTNNSNSPKFYTSSNCVHLYPNNTLTISSATNITSLSFTTLRNDGWSASTGTWTASSSSWTGNATSIVFTVSSTSGSQVRISQIDVNGGSSGGTTYYTGTKDCTLPTGVTITFHKNDGTDATTSQTISYNTATALTANTFSRTGYTFQGWATSATGTKAYDDEESVTLTKNTDLYAVWQLNSHNVSYTITPTGSATATINSSATTPQSIDYGESVTLDITPDAAYIVSEVTATGVMLSGTGTQRTFTMPDNDVAITITMVAKPKYTVTWSANGTTTTEEYIEGASIVFPATATGCDGKVFVGWSAVTVDETDTKPALVTSATMGSSPLTYYAVFAESSTGSGANKFKRITADDELVRASGTQIAIISNNAGKILQNDFTSVDAPTPDGEGLITVTDDQIWTLTEKDSYDYWKLMSGTVQLGVNTTSGYSSGYQVCGNYSTDASWWYITHADNVSGTADCFYLYNWSNGTWYDLLEYYGGTTQKWESVYFASSSATGFATYGATQIYIPATTYSGYTTTCVPCDYKVTLTKGEETNGTFTLSKSNGTYNNCTSNFVVTVSDITPATGYYCSGVTATGGNSTVTGPDGSGNYTVTYTKENNITSTITTNFASLPTYTVTWSSNGDESNKESYHEGDAISFPSTATGCDGMTFRGWSASTVAETDVEPTYVTSATMGTSDLTYYAVFANASGSSSGSGPDPGTTLWAETFSSYDADDVPSGEVDNSNTGTTVYGTGSVTYACKNGGTTTQIYSTGGPGSGNNLLISKGNGTFTVAGIPTGGATELTVTYAKSGSGSIKLTVSDNASKSGNASGSTITVNSGSTIDITFENTTSGSNLRLDDVAVKVAGEEITYSGYTTTCGASISAKNIGWITATKGQKVKREITVSAKNFDVATTLSATCANSHFKLSLGATAVPASSTDPAGLTTTLTVEYVPTDFGVREENVDIVLAAGEKTKTIKVNGRSLPEEFLLITQKSSKWYALPANMSEDAKEYDGVEVSPNNTTAPTVVPISPSTVIYGLKAELDSRYTDKGHCVRLVGNGDLCLWSNLGTSNTTKTNIQNKTNVATATGDNFDWLLTTTDGTRYTIANPNHPQYSDGRMLGFGTKFGMYIDETIFYIVSAGCSSQPEDVRVSAHRVDATFAWISNASSVKIEVFTDAGMTSLKTSATTTSAPYTITGLDEKTEYWFKLTPGTDTDCAVTGTFKTTGPSIDITEWKEDGVVLFIDKGDVNPVIVIDGQEEHGSITGGGGNATELFFAKYFEGAGNMKLISIFNGTNDPISLANYSIYIRCRGKENGWAPSSDVTLDLSSLGTITAGQEIIFFTRETSGELASCSDDFLDDKVTNSSSAESNPRWVECSGEPFKKITFNGNDPIMLYKSGTMIDIIGSQGAAATTYNCLTGNTSEKGWAGTVRNMDYGKSVDDPSFAAFYAASSMKPFDTKTDAEKKEVLEGFGINLDDEEINITTARCIFFRDKRVTSGDSAVLMNETNGTTFVTFTNHDAAGEPGTDFKSEWYGRSVCMNDAMKTAAGVTSDAQATCNSYQDIANMDYNEYYIDYTSHIEPGKLLDDYSHDPETHLYTIPITDLNKYTCLNLRFQLRDGEEVVTEAAQQVPIIVSGTKYTNDALFSQLVVDQETHLPSYSYSVERCKTCNVVVLGNATLEKVADGTEKDVPEVKDIKVYPGGKLVVPASGNYKINSLALRRQEDALSLADIKGGLTIGKDNSVFLDIRIDPTNWHYFTLPYDCNVSDIRFANENETAIPIVGTDFLLCSYDGEHRAATQSTSWKDLTSTDVLRKGVGYIIALPGEGKVQKEFRFPMSNDVIDEEKDPAGKTTGIFNAWGGNNSELRPNHKGWNLIGNPYMTYYETNLNDPLTTGILIHDPDEQPDWKGHWVIDDDIATKDVYYIVIPQDNGWSEYKQVAIANYHMAPFTSYFVQFGGNPSDDQTITYELGRAGRTNIVRRMPAEDEPDNHEVWFGVDLINADGESDETTLLMSDKFTNDYDMMRDLVKMRGTYYNYYTKPVLASRNNEGEMAFNALPDSTAAAGVPLNFFAAKDGDYRFTISGNYSLDEVKSAYLYDNDNATQKWHNLMESDYTFTTKRGDNTTRFMLAVTVERKQPEITTALDNISSKLTLTTINRTLVLSGLTSESDIYVYNVSGKLLSTGQYNASASGVFRTTVENAGLYFVRVCSKDGQQTLQTIVY